jgi:hypothetical protein
VGCNIQVHGSNNRNLSVYTSLTQASNNAVSFLLPLMFSLQQNWRQGQNRFCLEARGLKGSQLGGEGGRGGPNNVYTYE